MIIVRLQGGLGNQLFQYAAARSVADFHRTSVVFDLTFLHNRTADLPHTFREFSLDIFGIEPATPPFWARALSDSRSIRDGRKIMAALQRFSGLSRYKEKSFRYDPDIFQKTSSFSHLTGFFQSEKYFGGIAHMLRLELQFRQPLNSLEKLQIDSHSNSVSVHIRRGDYVSHPPTRAFHGICGLEYYHQALQYIAERKSGIHLFIFSDDYEWTKTNIKFPFPSTFMNGSQSEDLQSISLCKHHIIANSSFSWWGAWLNPSPDQIVIAPKRWFADDKAESQSFDIVPEKWIKI